MNKLSPQEMLETLKIPIYKDDEIVASMPTNKRGKKIELFNIGKFVTNKELMKEYDKRGLIPAYPYDLIKAYKDDSPYAFIATIWDFEKDLISYLAFNQWSGGERDVNVNRNGSEWGGNWWFAGVRESSKLSNSTFLEPKSLDLESRVAYLEEMMKKVNNMLILK